VCDRVSKHPSKVVGRQSKPKSTLDTLLSTWDYPVPDLSDAIPYGFPARQISDKKLTCEINGNTKSAPVLWFNY